MTTNPKAGKKLKLVNPTIAKAKKQLIPHPRIKLQIGRIRKGEKEKNLTSKFF